MLACFFFQMLMAFDPWSFNWTTVSWVSQPPWTWGSSLPGVYPNRATFLSEPQYSEICNLSVNWSIFFLLHCFFLLFVILFTVTTDASWNDTGLPPAYDALCRCNVIDVVRRRWRWRWRWIRRHKNANAKTVRHLNTVRNSNFNWPNIPKRRFKND